MHRIDDSIFLLYIEPNIMDRSDFPNNDTISKTVAKCLHMAETGIANYDDPNSTPIFNKGEAYRGNHKVTCGKHSDNVDYLLGNGMITNSLCAFYLRHYRTAIPASEMNKVVELCNWFNNTNREIT